MIFDNSAGLFAPSFSVVQPNELATYASTATAFASGSISWVKSVHTATSYSFTLIGSPQDGTEPLHVHGNFTAEYFPFGSTGTDDA